MEDIYRLFHDIYIFLDSGDTLVLSQFDLSQIQYRALMLLDLEEGKSQTVLSDELFRNRSTITRLIDQLEERDLVSREQRPTDRRTLYITLTPAGDKLRTDVHHAHLQSLRRRLSILSTEETSEFKRILHILRNSLLEDLETQSLGKGGHIEEP